MNIARILCSSAAAATLIASSFASSRGAGVDGEATQPWFHEIAHHRTAADFQGGSVQRAELPAGGGVRLRPVDQPRNVEDDGSAVFESRELRSKLPFQEVTMSWNLEAPRSAGVYVEIRVGRARDEHWSPWLRVGEWGNGGPRWAATTTFEDGRIDVDRFVSDWNWDRFQYRFQAWRGSSDKPVIKISRVVASLSSRDAIVPKELQPAVDPTAPAPISRIRLAVPFKSRWVDGAPDPDALSLPAAFAMIAAYRGVEIAPAELAERIGAAPRDWSRATQVAFTVGASGYLTHVARWLDVEHLIANGQPLIVELVAAEGARRVLVITGFDRDGRVLANDPAAADERGTRITLDRAVCEREWLELGGRAFVSLARG